MSDSGSADTNCPRGEQSLFQKGILLNVATHDLRCRKITGLYTFARADGIFFLAKKLAQIY